MELVRYEAMRLAIDEAHSVDEVKQIRDQAQAFLVYCKQAKDGLIDQQKVAEIKIRAERRAGELLRELPTAKNQYDKCSPHDGEGTIQTKGKIIEQSGISKGSADRWQQLADIPQDVFDGFIAESIEEGQELTTKSIARKVRERKRSDMVNDLISDPEMPSGKYRVLYADPPWKYSDSGVISDTDNYGRAERHYPTMSIEELCEMGEGIKRITEDNAVLFMWVTSPLLEDCFKVIRAWGFEYKSSFVWDKVGHNYGHYNSVRHEFLLICTRGSCTPDNKTLFDSVVSIEKSRKHSEKPVEFGDMIDELYTVGARIELFARTERPGWQTYGNEWQLVA